MEKFSIDLNASDKGERKKAVKYLKSKGLKFGDNDRFKDSQHWSYISVASGEFVYITQMTHNPTILTLPCDWDKFVEIVNEDSKAMKVSCDKILSKAKKSEAKVAFDGMFDNLTCPTNPNSFFAWNPKGCSMVESLELELENKLLQAKIDLAKKELEETIKKL